MPAYDNPCSIAAYEEKKALLSQNLLRHSREKSTAIALYKESSNLFRSRRSERSNLLCDVRNFNHVLRVDNEALFTSVEGMTSYQQLTAETLKSSCLPAVVPELKSITIGGALSGCGIESSSFRYGLVHETIEEIEVLLGDGSIINCTPLNEYSDLFFAFPNSYGTLGYALKVKAKLVPAKKFVKLTHHPFKDPKQFFNVLKQMCLENRTAGCIAFIDGAVFDKDNLVITTGEFVDAAPYLSNYRYMNIYFRSMIQRNEDYLTTSDYIWRWDADWFWCSDVFFMQNPIFRFLLGKWMLSSAVYSKIMHFTHRHPLISKLLEIVQGQKESVIQDILIPVENALEFLKFIQSEIGIKPIWICPIHPLSPQTHFDLCPLKPDSLYIDFGFWKSIPAKQEKGYHNRKIEQKCAELQGFKSLYSSSYYSEEEFWKLFPRERYRQLKQKYDPNYLLGDLYNKCTLPKA